MINNLEHRPKVNTRSSSFYGREVDEYSGSTSTSRRRRRLSSSSVSSISDVELKYRDVRRNGNRKLSHREKSSQPTVELYDWIIRPLPDVKGVCVEGQKKGMTDFWHSSAITEVKRRKFVKTASGAVYRLKGKLNKLCTLETGFSKNVVDAFAHGFPSDWKEVLENFYSHLAHSISIDEECSDVRGYSLKKLGGMRKKRSAVKDSEQKEENLNNLDSILTAVGLVKRCNSAENFTTTRSGRLSLPPLAQWQGQRYIISTKSNTLSVRFHTTPAENALLEDTSSFMKLDRRLQKPLFHKSLSNSILDCTLNTSISSTGGKQKVSTETKSPDNTHVTGTRNNLQRDTVSSCKFNGTGKVSKGKSMLSGSKKFVKSRITNNGSKGDYCKDFKLKNSPRVFLTDCFIDKMETRLARKKRESDTLNECTVSKDDTDISKRKSSPRTVPGSNNELNTSMSDGVLDCSMVLRNRAITRSDMDDSFERWKERNNKKDTASSLQRRKAHNDKRDEPSSLKRRKEKNNQTNMPHKKWNGREKLKSCSSSVNDGRSRKHADWEIVEKNIGILKQVMNGDKPDKRLSFYPTPVINKGNKRSVSVSSETPSSSNSAKETQDETSCGRKKRKCAQSSKKRGYCKLSVSPTPVINKGNKRSISMSSETPSSSNSAQENQDETSRGRKKRTCTQSSRKRGYCELSVSPSPVINKQNKRSILMSSETPSSSNSAQENQDETSCSRKKKKCVQSSKKRGYCELSVSPSPVINKQNKRSILMSSETPSSSNSAAQENQDETSCSWKKRKCVQSSKKRGYCESPFSDDTGYSTEEQSCLKRHQDATPKSYEKEPARKRRKLSLSAVTENELGSTWTAEEKDLFERALRSVDANSSNYWSRVSTIVSSKTEIECRYYHTTYLEQKTKKLPEMKKVARTISGRQKGEPVRGGKGTLKRKEGIREFLNEQDEDYEDNPFEGTPYISRKLPIPVITNINFDKDDSEIFGSNHNFITPMAKNSKFGTPGTQLRAQLASTRKTPTYQPTNQTVNDTPVAVIRQAADKYIHTMMNQAKRDSTDTKTNSNSTTQMRNTSRIDLSRMSSKSLFSPSIVVHDEDKQNEDIEEEEENNPFVFYWDEDE